MKELYLTDSEAEQLLFMLKKLITNETKTLEYNDSGSLEIKGSGDITFKLDYRYTKRKKSFNFRETTYNYSLARVNIGNDFHKNADGEKIHGNRINVFSTDEYYKKADGKTHYKAYPLPYKTIENTDDFILMLEQLLQFTNTEKNNKLNLSIQGNLV